MILRAISAPLPDHVFYPLWKRQFDHQLKQMHAQAILLGYPKIDNFGDFCLHLYETCPDLVNESLN